MPGTRIPLSDSAKELLALVRHGKLFAVEQWVAAGKTLRFPELRNHRSVLCDAIDSGFHSMLEVVLRSDTWAPEELTGALRCALHHRRLDLVELVISQGASVTSIDFAEVCASMNTNLMEAFLRAGGDPAKDNAFARALGEHKAKPLLGFYRAMRTEYPALDAQAALALQEAVEQGNLRWTALLAWAGADPLMPVPYHVDEDWGPADEMTTAASSAAFSENENLLLALKLKSTREVALELSPGVAFRPSLAKVKMLAGALSRDELNVGERKSCKALEGLVSQHKWQHEWSRVIPDEDKRRLECIEFLLDRGARWNPSDEGIHETRRGLGSREAKYVVQVLRLLLYTPGAVDVARLWELCRTDKLRRMIRSADEKLWDELLELRSS